MKYSISSAISNQLGKPHWITNVIGNQKAITNVLSEQSSGICK